MRQRRDAYSSCKFNLLVAHWRCNGDGLPVVSVSRSLDEASSLSCGRLTAGTGHRCKCLHPIRKGGASRCVRRFSSPESNVGRRDFAHRPRPIWGLMNRRHHHTCRCNDCVRRRNGRRRRQEEQDAERGTPRPSGSTLYEVMRDLPPLYEYEVRQREQRERQQLQVLEHIFETALPPPESEEREPERTEAQQSENEERYRRAQEQYLESARQEREEEERRRQARAVSREAARRIREQEQEPREGMSPGNQQTPAEFGQPPPDLADGEPLPDLLPSLPRDTPKRLFAPLLLTLLPLAAIVGIGLLAYWLLSDPANASSQVTEPTPDLESTIQAMVALAVTRTAPTPVAPSDDAEPEKPEPAAASAGGQGVEVSSPASAPTPPPARLRASMCSYCDTSDAGLGHYVQWEWEPTVTATGWLSFRVLIDERAGFSPDDPPRCTPANVSLSDADGAFYGWILPRSKAQRCGTLASDWVSNSYDYENDWLSLGVQLDAPAATHPGLEVCLWTGGATKKETRLLNCRPVRQPSPTEG